VQLELVVLNLAINARDAMPVGGPLTIATTNVTLGAPKTPHDTDPGEYVEVCVTDADTGMPPEVLERAFEPFFTTKDVGKGSGLGLAQVYGFAKQSGGGLRIETQVGSGTSVKVYLPRAAIEPAVDSEPGLPVAAHIEGGRSRVLVVDDDIEVRDVVTSIVEGFGYHVTAAESGAAALDLLDREAPFDLILVDFAMPGMNGVELARRVEVSKPGLPTVFITGYADVRAMSEIGTRPVVLKPFKRDSLGATLQAAIRNGERVFLSP
jgi:CheY-like chemotaxis protein